jgi:hypothetical protein
LAAETKIIQQREIEEQKKFEVEERARADQALSIQRENKKNVEEFQREMRERYEEKKQRDLEK